ncbi:similar to Saccharomyces cerevisiae YBR055C PRP6 Splicing factor, component of the U4/U6-U5 snRNP complex [Maudiozyma barnettii]|uniref:Similar to Saccharomyces cerevisiae YBR055C PRP6 Splicing factor, component of the U4/U6-U5 snRNP complex n=1 Tax=Maudiozyma barnettii TaxID=61262 RepID=A0A8H2ZGA5_9SACH|nr:U4/U6-U5 snRNP complex subunit PRP6 [Kazachstania barnettii]CAB4253129.1 similar to Saccharomyces cerevisiae YBR055C PRP6 Splicing factor, component of the U4/U6-U5 snRNP complex [Kazachstania barnettii]CAD1780335.1 similar to Saccharomyces cerevisiae YBR055C PRP6 Splicing factor, component of the U4/U6-U5 snRNP complex [Kazachstania barnettii]
MDRPPFLDLKPPKGYVAGLGRGATGFSVRGDKFQRKVPVRLQDEKRRELKGKTIVKDAAQSEEDEAMKIFSIIDLKRNGNKLAKVDNAFQDSLNEGYKFNDLKRNLGSVSEDQWLSIPEATDFTRRNKRNRLEEQLNRKTYAAPDSLISQNVNLSKLTEEREKLLEMTLDVNIKGKMGEIDIDSSKESLSYLNQLESVTNTTNETQLEDLKKMRLVFQSYRKADPKKSEGWIASARLEEKCRRFEAAKRLIEEGCQNCPHDEEIWLENIRLHYADNHKCKVIVTTAIKFNYNSVKLWLKAIDLENEKINKYRVVRKALEEVPTSEELWNLAVEYEKNKNEKINILRKALEFVPQSLHLWTILIKVEEYNEAKILLNRARKLIPNNIKIWLLAIELEETHGNNDISVFKLMKILNKGFEQLSANSISITFEDGLRISKEFETSNEGHCEKSLEALAQVIIMKTTEEHGLNIDNEKLKMLLKFDDSLTKLYFIRQVVLVNYERLSLWNSLKEVCEKLGRVNELYNTFEKILFSGDETDQKKILEPNSKLVLVYAKEVWKGKNDIKKALAIIDKCLGMIPDNLDIIAAKLKLLCQSRQFDTAELLFKEKINQMIDQKNVSNQPGLERLVHKYVSFLRHQRENELAITLISDQFIPLFHNCYKLYLQLGQIYCHLENYTDARSILVQGTEKFPGNNKSNSHNALLWIEISKIEEIAMEKPIKARATLDIALIKNSGNPTCEIMIYIARIQLEKRTNNNDQAQLLVSQGLKAYPNSALLWTENITLLDTKRSSQKKTVFQDALRNTKNSYLVMLEIGKTFYKECQYTTAIKWIERATKANPAYGDSWVWNYRCERKLNRDTKGIIQKVSSVEPVYGPEWISISKNPASQYFSSKEILKTLTSKEKHNQ